MLQPAPFLAAVREHLVVRRGRTVQAFSLQGAADVEVRVLRMA